MTAPSCQRYTTLTMHMTYCLMFAHTLLSFPCIVVIIIIIRCILCDLGVYGDVQRVKIMFNKKDNALVQFTDASQANTGNVK